LAGSPCKQRASRKPPAALLRRALAVAALTLPLSACSAPPRRPGLSLQEIEAAPVTAPMAPMHILIADPRPLRDLIRPLGRRIGLLEVRSESEWERLRAAAPHIGDCPDLRNGLLMGLVSELGEPLRRDVWPVSIGAVQVFSGAGLVTGAFQPGSYFPDGAMFVTAAIIPDLVAVVAVDLNGVRFFPE
jgi:hypothetical protein